MTPLGWLGRKTSTQTKAAPLILLYMHTFTHSFANTVDPDETARDEPSHKDLHCLPFYYWFLTEPLFATTGVYKFRDGSAHLRNSGMKRLAYSELFKENLYSFKGDGSVNFVFGSNWKVVCSKRKECASLIKPLLHFGRKAGLNGQILMLTSRVKSLLICGVYFITKTRLFKYTENFTTKNWKF